MLLGKKKIKEGIKVRKEMDGKSVFITLDYIQRKKILCCSSSLQPRAPLKPSAAVPKLISWKVCVWAT